MKLCFFSKQNFLIDKNSGGNKLSGELFNIFLTVLGKENVSLVMIDMQNRNLEIKEIDDYSTHVIRAYHSTFSKNINYLFLRDEVSGKEKKKIIDVLREEDADCYFFDGTWMGSFSEKLKGKKIIAFYHNIEKQLAYNRVKKDRGIIGIPRYLSNWKNEKKLTNNANIRVCLNQRDSELLKNYYDRRPEVILPIFVSDPGKIKEKRFDEKMTLLFVGSYFYPNVHGIRWFCSKVMPRLNCKLNIVGKGMDLLKDELSNEKVKVYGFADSLEAAYQEADVVVLPIFSGGGMKVKTAEALSYGKIVIATKEALEGYDYTAKNDIWECNSEEEFILAIEEIVKTRKSSYSRINYKLFKEKYSYDMARQKIQEVILKIENE